MTTILYGAVDAHTTDAAVSDDDALWLRLDQLTRTTGWELKPEGACRGAVCVAIPAERATTFVRGSGADSQFNIAALAHVLNAPLLHDPAHDVWCIGEATASRAERMMSLEAPDFALPDVDGRVHRLSDFRGRRVFLLAWASW